MNEKTIWNYLKKQGFTDYGIAGLMGNLYAESQLNPQNLQNSYEKKLQLSNSQYTEAVDNKSYLRFVDDSAGYGLAQWTHSSRKAALLKFIQNKKTSIGDLNTQLDFLIYELKSSYKSVYQILCSATSVLEASNAVLLQYEKPASKNTKLTQTTRANYGLKYYKQFATINPKQEDTIMNFTRNLKLNMYGTDVKYIKQQLLKLGYYNKSKVTKISNSWFRNDTLQAVILFQGRNVDKYGNPLSTDGIVGKLTWEAIESASIISNNSPKQEETSLSNDIIKIIDTYSHISSSKREAIKADLLSVSELRQKIIVEILNYAYDKDVPGNVRALYMIGGNLYNSDLKINIPTESKIISQAKAKPDYYSNGRDKWMIEQIRRNPMLPASDCSGLEIGYMRKYGLISKSTDTTANNLSTKSSYSTAISRSQLKPGDWVAKDGHIGTYVGGGYVVEFYGGAYGCQLTEVDNRQGYDFVNKKVYRGGAWTRFRRPIKY